MTQLVNNIGPTCGAMAALLLAIILAATYGTRRLMQHVHRIARVLEDVAHMRVETGMRPMIFFLPALTRQSIIAA